jgi:adenosylhomocysteine nucleosidase
MPAAGFSRRADTCAGPERRLKQAAATNGCPAKSVWQAKARSEPSFYYLMRILLIASDPREFAGLLAHATGAEPCGAAVSWARRVRLGAHEALLAANGVGAARAAAGVDAALSVFDAEAVVSTGFCGALEPGFGVAEVVVATEIHADGQVFPVMQVSSDSGFHRGPVVSLSRVARTAEQKAKLRASGACAVEMEAAGVLLRACERRLPFYCIRAVTDLAGESLENDFEACLRSDGYFDTITLISNALHRPLRRFPELLRLRRRSARASRALGDFLAHCRF